MKALAKRSFGILFATALCLACALPSFAEVYTERSGGGKADSVYVAGNPELYPIEYYDNARGEYRGLVPDMLRDISSRTGIDFTYISATTISEFICSLFATVRAELSAERRCSHAGRTASSDFYSRPTLSTC